MTQEVIDIIKDGKLEEYLEENEIEQEDLAAVVNCLIGCIRDNCQEEDKDVDCLSCLDALVVEEQEDVVEESLAEEVDYPEDDLDDLEYDPEYGEGQVDEFDLNFDDAVLDAVPDVEDDDYWEQHADEVAAEVEEQEKIKQQYYDDYDNF